MSDLTGSPASLRDLAVPPDATNDKPTETSRLANSTSPVLSDTLSKAERDQQSDKHKLCMQKTIQKYDILTTAQLLHKPKLDQTSKIMIESDGITIVC